VIKIVKKGEEEIVFEREKMRIDPKKYLCKGIKSRRKIQRKD
jgi:hypothetical protein